MIRMPRSVILTVVLLVFAIGCGKAEPARAPIGGEIKLDAKSLETGSILFVPMDGANGAVTGGPIENGRYAISQADGAALGWNRVEIRSSRNTGKTIYPYGPGTAPSTETIQMVAPQYNTKSTLKAEVKPGQNKADFEVTSK